MLRRGMRCLDSNIHQSRRFNRQWRNGWRRRQCKQWWMLPIHREGRRKVGEKYITFRHFVASCNGVYSPVRVGSPGEDGSYVPIPQITP